MCCDACMKVASPGVRMNCFIQMSGSSKADRWKSVWMMTV